MRQLIIFVALGLCCLVAALSVEAGSVKDMISRWETTATKEKEEAAKLAPRSQPRVKTQSKPQGAPTSSPVNIQSAPSQQQQSPPSEEIAKTDSILTAEVESVQVNEPPKVGQPLKSDSEQVADEHLVSAVDSESTPIKSMSSSSPDIHSHPVETPVFSSSVDDKEEENFLHDMGNVHSSNEIVETPMDSGNLFELKHEEDDHKAGQTGKDAKLETEEEEDPLLHMGEVHPSEEKEDNSFHIKRLFHSDQDV